MAKQLGPFCFSLVDEAHFFIHMLECKRSSCCSRKKKKKKSYCEETLRANQCLPLRLLVLSCPHPGSYMLSCAAWEPTRLELFWVLVWNVCWYLSLKWTCCLWQERRLPDILLSVAICSVRNLARWPASYSMPGCCFFSLFSRWGNFLHVALCWISQLRCWPSEWHSCCLRSILRLVSHDDTLPQRDNNYAHVRLHNILTNTLIKAQWSTGNEPACVFVCACLCVRARLCQTCLSCGYLFLRGGWRMTKPPRAK